MKTSGPVRRRSLYLGERPKGSMGTHTLESVDVCADVGDLLLAPGELSDEQLSNVIGGMMPDRFELWCAKTINNWYGVNGA